MRTRLSTGAHGKRLRRRVRRTATYGCRPVGCERELCGVRRIDQARESMLAQDPRI